PNESGDWINQRDERSATWRAIGDKKTKGKPETEGIFQSFGTGLNTARDAWVYNFSESAVQRNVETHVRHLNDERTRVWRLIDEGESRAPEQILQRDSSRGSWDRINVADLKRNRPTIIDEHGFRVGQH